MLRSLSSEDLDATSGRLEVRATLLSSGKRDDLMEQIVNRLSLEPSVSAGSWEVLSQGGEGEVNQLLVSDAVALWGGLSTMIACRVWRLAAG